MRKTNTRLCTDLTNHLSNRIRHLCGEVVDTANRADLSNDEIASVLLTALACDLVDAAMMLGLTDNEFLDLMQHRQIDERCQRNPRDYEDPAPSPINSGFAVHPAPTS